MYASGYMASLKQHTGGGGVPKCIFEESLQATSHGRLMAECLQASGNVLMRPQLVRLIRHLPANGLDASLTLLHG